MNNEFADPNEGINAIIKYLKKYSKDFIDFVKFITIP